jgi:hypothetical protein
MRASRQNSDSAESLARPEFCRWITGAEVIASIFGLAIIGMALMGAAGVSLKEVQVSAVEVPK